MFGLTRHEAPAAPRQRNRVRQHRTPVRQLDRRTLERGGWRTTLEFRENHVRSTSGRLIEVESVWLAEAERTDPDTGVVTVVTATARSESRVWARVVAETQAVEDRAGMARGS